MKEMQIFNNEEFGEVRTIIINGEPWFVGKDIASALGYSKVSEALKTNVDEMDSSLVGVMDALGREQQTKVINESGLYSLIFGSKLETAKKFKRWVTSDVLPTLHKTGVYAIKSAPLAERPGEVAKLINSLTSIMKNNRSASKEIAENAKIICEQYGIRLIDNFVKMPEYEQLALSIKEVG